MPRSAARRRLQPTGPNPVSKELTNAAIQKLSGLLANKLAAKGSQLPQRAQRRRRQVPNQAMINASLRSIPRVVAPKPQRFARGAPQSSVAFAARGHGYYDAFVNRAEALILGSQVGPSTPIEGFARATIKGDAGVDDLAYALDGTYYGYATASITSNATLILFNPGSSGTAVARVYKLKADPVQPTRAIVTHTTIHAAAFAGLSSAVHIGTEDAGVVESVEQPAEVSGVGPLPAYTSPLGPNILTGTTGSVESIPVRGSIRIRNITEALAVGGEVRFMRYNGGLRTVDDLSSGAGMQYGTDGNPTNGVGPSPTPPAAGEAPPYTTLAGEMSVATFVEITEMLRDTTRSHTLSGHELCSMHQTNTHPADFVRSHNFRYDTTFAEALLTPKYCTSIFLIEDFSSSSSGINNTYSITCNVQRAARFKPGSLLHNKSQPTPASSQNHSKHTHMEILKPPVQPVKPFNFDRVWSTGKQVLPYANMAMQAWPALQKAGPILAEMAPIL